MVDFEFEVWCVKFVVYSVEVLEVLKLFKWEIWGVLVWWWVWIWSLNCGFEWECGFDLNFGFSLYGLWVWSWRLDFEGILEFWRDIRILIGGFWTKVEVCSFKVLRFWNFKIESLKLFWNLEVIWNGGGFGVLN